jgi:sirohydrochlorin cobaltochelatase
LQKEIRVTQTSCMGYCGDGPAVAVYPDGVWYRRCEEKYAEELFEKHLMKDELVTDIVDQIMQ